MNTQIVQDGRTDNPYDYKRFAVLYVDDEETSLKLLPRAFQDHFRMLTAPSTREGLTLLDQHKDEIGLLMTDERMPGERGVWLLEQARQLRPRIIRILATAYTDYDAAIAAVNSGAIYKSVHKPWNLDLLETILKRGLEFFMVQRERDVLLKEKMALLQERMIADRIISFGLLTAGLSQHIRTPLVAVKTFLDLAPAKMAEEKAHLDGLLHPDFWKEFYHDVQGQMERINKMLRDLRTASEMPAPEFADRVRLHEIVGEVIARLQGAFAAKDIQVDNLIPKSLPMLYVDRPKFCRLFELLLRDEIACLPAGARITLSATPLGGAQPGEEEIQVQVSDNGPALPQETLRVLFDPFALRGDTPLEYGIHLMACYFIVHHHGGRITARSEEDQGTTFTLCLPTNPARAQPPQGDPQLLEKVQLSESLWENLISSN